MSEDNDDDDDVIILLSVSVPYRRMTDVNYGVRESQEWKGSDEGGQQGLSDLGLG